MRTQTTSSTHRLLLPTPARPARPRRSSPTPAMYASQLPRRGCGSRGRPPALFRCRPTQSDSECSCSGCAARQSVRGVSILRTLTTTPDGPPTAAPTEPGAGTRPCTLAATSAWDTHQVARLVSVERRHSVADRATMTHSVDAAPRFPALKLSTKRTQRRSNGTSVPLRRYTGRQQPRLRTRTPEQCRQEPRARTHPEVTQAIGALRPASCPQSLASAI